MTALDDFLAQVSGASWLWYVKYLSANDTYAKPNVHQAGPYLSKPLLISAFPEMLRRSRVEKNPDTTINASIDSHGWVGDVRAVWYNSKVLERRASGRDEARLTGWGGSQNPLVEPAATGSLAIFAWELDSGKDPRCLRIWIARGLQEVELITAGLGEVEPGSGIIWSPVGAHHEQQSRLRSCELATDAMPLQWLSEFPTGDAIISWVLENRDAWRAMDADRRLVRRRACEFDVFKSIEREHVLPRIQGGFGSVDAFIEYSNGVANRRKSRAGRSLELHVKAILDENGISYSWTPRTEGARKPDFIFPSIEHYQNENTLPESLHMLAAKTTCKDRWRQVLNEAARIERKHLLTLQEGVSLEQHREMEEEGVQLVVPAELFRSYPKELHSAIISFEDFLTLVR